MSRYAAYSPTTGAILRVGECQEMDLALQGVHIVSAKADGDLHYISDGVLVDLPTKPSKKHVWQGPERGWVDSRTIAHAKADAWARIKAERERRMAGAFTHAGNTYDIDPTNLSGASIDAREALIAGEAWSQMWVLANNTVATLTATEMIAVGRACKTVVSNLWATSQYLRGLIDAATTIAQVEAIAWP